MSEYSKKLHVKYNGTQEDIKLYTATNDVGSNYLSINDGSTISYAKLDNSTGTNLHIRKNDTIYNVMKEAITRLVLPADCTQYMENNYASTYATMTVLPDELQNADASNVTKMVSMFGDSFKLTTIPQFDTSKVTNMRSMFEGCYSLREIPLLNTSKVTDMNAMFAWCSGLTTIPKLNTSNATDMGYIFDDCTKLTTIPQLDTSKATTMGGMFKNCKSLPSVFPWVVDCSSITNIKYIFKDSSVKEVTFKNVKSSIASQFTAANLGTQLTKITIQNTIA